MKAKKLYLLLLLSISVFYCYGQASDENFEVDGIDGYEWLEGEWINDGGSHTNSIYITKEYYQSISHDELDESVNVFDEPKEPISIEKVYLSVFESDFLTIDGFYYLDVAKRQLFWIYDFSYKMYMIKEGSPSNEHRDYYYSSESISPSLIGGWVYPTESDVIYWIDENYKIKKYKNGIVCNKGTISYDNYGDAVINWEKEDEEDMFLSCLSGGLYIEGSDFEFLKLPDKGWNFGDELKASIYTENPQKSIKNVSWIFGEWRIPLNHPSEKSYFIKITPFYYQETTAEGDAVDFSSLPKKKYKVMEGYNSMLDGYVYYFDNIYLDIESKSLIYTTFPDKCIYLDKTSDESIKYRILFGLVATILGVAIIIVLIVLIRKRKAQLEELEKEEKEKQELEKQELEKQQAQLKISEDVSNSPGKEEIIETAQESTPDYKEYVSKIKESVIEVKGKTQELLEQFNASPAKEKIVEVLLKIKAVITKMAKAIKSNKTVRITVIIASICVLLIIIISIAVNSGSRGYDHGYDLETTPYSNDGGRQNGSESSSSKANALERQYREYRKEWDKAYKKMNNAPFGPERDRAINDMEYYEKKAEQIQEEYRRVTGQPLY